MTVANNIKSIVSETMNFNNLDKIFLYTFKLQ